MSKKNREEGRRDPDPPRRPSGGATGVVEVLTLIGVAVAVLLSALSWSRTSTLQKSIDERLGQLAAGMNQLGGKLDAAAKGQQAPRQGPDPNKVYTIRTAGAPAEGPETAPVTIAEFSDFQ
jgi:hypothetical protein